MKLRKNKEEIPSYEKREILAAAKTTKIKQPKPANTDKNIHCGHRDRLKNQYLKNGINTMTDIQQLELLLFYTIPQKDTNPIAHKLLDKFGSIKNVLSADINELIKIDGIKENSATYLKLVSNMANVCSLPEEGEDLTYTDNSKAFCEKLFVGINVEQVYVICLSTSNKVIGTKLLKSGSVDQVKLEIRDITQFALSMNCNRIILTHNHPQGECKMSDEDLRFTYSLVCSCVLNDIELLDHIIIGNDGIYSFHENQLIDQLEKRSYKKVTLSNDVRLKLSNIRKSYIRSQTFDTKINIDLL